MKFRFTTMLLLTMCIFALLMPNTTLAEDEGKIKVGIFYDNEKFRNNDAALSWYGSYGGVLLGYEKKLGDFWWAIDGRYKYGRIGDEKADENLAYIEGQSIVGKTYDINGFLVKPFIGVGFGWEASDSVGHKDSYVTEYLLPVGARIERNTTVGLVGVDLQYRYVLGRQLYVTDGDHSWGSRFFDGSYNLEVGLYHEPVALPIGFRTYFKYEKWQKSKFWSPVEREHVGIETYVKF